MSKVYKQREVVLERLNTVVGIADGGLGTTTLAEMKNTLNYISKDDVNKANGVATLNHLGKIQDAQMPSVTPPQLSSLDGPRFVSVNGGAKQYVITNYNSFYTYTVSVSAGTYTRSGTTITYTPPSTAQDVTITLRSQMSANNIDSTIAIKVTITAASTPNKPIFIYPANGSVRIGKSVTLESSAFSIDGSFTHSKSDWEVAKNNTFVSTSLVATSYDSTFNKVTFSLVDLEENTTYYARVRHTANNNVKSSWSDTLTFITVTDFDISYQILEDYHPDAANEYFGTSVLVSEDETFWIGGAPGKDSNKGMVYLHFKDNVYVPSAAIWRLRSDTGIIPTPASAANSNFGYSMDIDASSTRLVVGAPGTTVSGKANAGCVYVFRRISTDHKWALEATLTANDAAANDRFGHSVCINRMSNKIVVGAPYANSGTAGGTGKVYTFNRSNVTWSYYKTIMRVATETGQLFGYSISITGDGVHLFVGAPGNENNRLGSIHHYRDSGTAWGDYGTITSGVEGDEFGRSVNIVNSSEIIDTYDILVVGAPGSDGGKGVVYAYKNIIKVNPQLFTPMFKLESEDDHKERFGESVTVRSDGRLIYVGAPKALTTNADGSAMVESGCVYSYKVENDTATYFDKIVGRVRANGGSFGSSVYTSRNPANKYLFVGDRLANNTNFNASGKVYIFN